MSARAAVRAVVTREYAVSAEQVFDAWLKRSMIEQWMFGPAVRDEEIIHLVMDPRVGGTFSFLVERDGENLEHLGKYLEIDRPRRLVFSWMVADEPVGSRVTVEIASGETGSEVTLTQELHPALANQIAAAEASWARMLEVLASVLAEE